MKKSKKHLGIKKYLKKLMKINSILVCISLIIGLVSFAPTISAQTKYKTLAFDKKLDKKQDFENGKFQNVQLEEKNGGIEMSSADGQQGEYTTPVVEAPFGATHIGLHWKEKLAGENLITAYIRTGNDAENLGEWTKASVEMDESRDGKKSEEIFAALVGTANTKFAQARIEFIPENRIAPKLKSLTFTFLNSGEASKQVTKKLSLAPTSTAEGVGTLKTSPSGQSVSVISREDWGADESYRLNTDGSENWPRSYHGTRKLVVHHTAIVSSNGETDLEANKATVRSVYFYHAVTQGWGDIGYNALVDAAGNVYEGRYGTHGTSPIRSIPSADQIMALDVEAGHTSGYNSGSFGVSAMGDFTSFDVPDAQKTGLEKTLAFVADSRGINTQGNTDFLRYDGIWHNGLNNVIAHRDATATACPGDKLYAQMTTIKSTVDNLPGMLSNLNGFSATVNTIPISGTSVGLGTINFGWSAFSGATQYQYALERVYGTTGDASNSEPWETAWLNPENTNMQPTPNTSVQIDASTLQLNSNYVFYVRALDANGLPISNVSHVNFKRNSLVPDAVAPVAKILKPLDGARVSGTVAVSASATDNIKVVKFELYIDGAKKTTTTSGSLSYNWNTKRVSIGSHTISVKAYDAAGNIGTVSIAVTK